MVTYTVLRNFVEYTAKDLTITTPESWGWQALNGNVSSATVETSDVHSGRIAVRIVHKTPFAPNVYGMYVCDRNIMLKAGQPYTFSTWARTSDPGQITMVLDSSWNQRMFIPDTHGKWERISKTYTPPKDDLIAPRLVSEKPTTGVLIDDISIVQGNEPEAGKNLLPNPSFESSWNAHRATFEIQDMEKMSTRLRALIDWRKTAPGFRKYHGELVRVAPPLKGRVSLGRRRRGRIRTELPTGPFSSSVTDISIKCVTTSSSSQLME